jgi:predicted CoA-binding protein
MYISWFETAHRTAQVRCRGSTSSPSGPQDYFEMNHDAYPDNYIREILNGVKSIAMVGASPVNVRPSYFAFKYLAQRGYDMIPVNPGHVGKSLLGKPFVASLQDIGRPFDMVDIFRNSSHIMPVVDEALRLTPLPKINLDATRRA